MEGDLESEFSGGNKAVGTKRGVKAVSSSLSGKVTSKLAQINALMRLKSSLVSSEPAAGGHE